MEPGFERRFAVFVSRLTVNLTARNLREGAPIRALLNRCHRVFQELLMSREKRIRHSDYPVGTSSRLRKAYVAAKLLGVSDLIARARHSVATAACSSVEFGT